MAIWPVYGVLLIVHSLYSASRHAIARPARETLFTVVTREDTYKAKAFVDTFVHRSGNVVGAQAWRIVMVMSVGMMSVVLLTIPAAIVWSALAIWLGLSQRRRFMALSRTCPECPADLQGLQPNDAGGFTRPNCSPDVLPGGQNPSDVEPA